MINGEYADINGGLIIINAKPPLKEILATSDNYPKGWHEGNVAGLDAVDADLAVGNIKETVTIFGKLGTYAGEALAEDILGDAFSALASTSAGGYMGSESIDAETSEILVTKTQDYDASSLAVGVAWGVFQTQADSVKISVWMDGVKMNEGAFVAGVGEVHVLMATKALSGSANCSIRAHNYNVAGRTLLIAGVLNNGEVACGIAVGSVKA